jgi:hypothetical protein
MAIHEKCQSQRFNRFKLLKVFLQMGQTFQVQRI